MIRVRAAEIDEQRIIPERRLVLHVLRRAYADIWLDGNTSDNEREDARRWIEGDSIEPYSFRWACAIVGWRYQDVRRVMLTRPAERTLLYGK